MEEKFLTTYLALTVGPEIGHHADYVIKRRIGPLIEKGRHQSAHWIHHQPNLNAPVRKGPGDRL